ncbi:unnamed protein product [Protopolystoma xenopodis]|uniref:ABC transmembrane type-1 domain-containing protein n=1 Tax=Protopolystoma xenopodis TaxID=117903 RepID=A0A448XJH0_9PLAT|nr:unnamed protein product [Protopolystoma xenopodis]
MLTFNDKLLGAAFMLGAAFLAVARRDLISPGLAGLIITHALQFSSTLTWLVKQISDLETSSVSLERLHEYSMVTILDSMSLVLLHKAFHLYLGFKCIRFSCSTALN